MAFGSVRLVPGINVERTPTLLEAGYSSSSLIRFKDALSQKIGGWEKFYPFLVEGTPRALHAWQDLNTDDHLAVGTTTQLGVITDSLLTDITPQTETTNSTPNFSITSGDTTVTIVDAGISNVTVFDSIYLNTPISVGGIILSGLYPITLISGATSYQIEAADTATSTGTNAGVVPEFDTTSGSSTVVVTFPAHGLSAGGTTNFPIPTTVGGVTIEGQYTVISVGSVNEYSITASAQASSTTSAFMNAGLAQIVYYITLGPPATGVGFGVGGFGVGGFGTGVVPTSQTGDPITATDWTLDNWGQLLVACPKNGGIYYWDPRGGFLNASLVSAGPIFNAGIFVSMSTQILVAYGSTVTNDIGVAQDPMLVRWSDQGNFLQWAVNATTQAGSYRIPNGSMIVGGMAITLKNLIWTDLGCWAMTYVGQPYVFGFDEIGAGAGLVGPHAAVKMRGNVYWMGRSNFYVLSGSGVQVIPCSVWDAVFQNINTAHLTRCWAWANTPFNEVWFFYPSSASSNGECDSYAKVNITEPGQPWDYGSLPRSCGIDQSVLGTPIAATPTSIIYQHEMGTDADGQPLPWSWTTGYFYLAEGEDFAFIDQILPDWKFGTFNGAQSAQIQMTFNVIDYTSETPRTYGPYDVTQLTPYIMSRFRGRQMSITASGNDIGSFSRLGKIRYRYSPDGRR